MAVYASPLASTAEAMSLPLIWPLTSAPAPSILPFIISSATSGLATELTSLGGMSETFFSFAAAFAAAAARFAAIDPGAGGLGAAVDLAAVGLVPGAFVFGEDRAARVDLAALVGGGLGFADAVAGDTFGASGFAVRDARVEVRAAVGRVVVRDTPLVVADVGRDVAGGLEAGGTGRAGRANGFFSSGFFVAATPGAPGRAVVGLEAGLGRVVALVVVVLVVDDVLVVDVADDLEVPGALPTFVVAASLEDPVVGVGLLVSAEFGLLTAGRGRAAAAFVVVGAGLVVGAILDLSADVGRALESVGFFVGEGFPLVRGGVGLDAGLDGFVATGALTGVFVRAAAPVVGAFLAVTDIFSCVAGFFSSFAFFEISAVIFSSFSDFSISLGASFLISVNTSSFA